LYEDGTTPETAASVRFDRSNGALLLVAIDGRDPRSFPSTAKYAELVRNGEAKTPPGRKPGLVTFSPGRNEPRLVGVTPGPHKYGVLYMLIANARAGLLLDSPMAVALAAKYLPDNTALAVSVKRYEDITFTAEAGKNYKFGYSWAPETLDLHITLDECSKKWKECVSVPFQSENAQTKVLSGASDQEI
jgi:hypothetical protein